MREYLNEGSKKEGDRITEEQQERKEDRDGRGWMESLRRRTNNSSKENAEEWMMIHSLSLSYPSLSLSYPSLSLSLTLLSDMRRGWFLLPKGMRIGSVLQPEPYLARVLEKGVWCYRKEFDCVPFSLSSHEG